MKINRSFESGKKTLRFPDTKEYPGSDSSTDLNEKQKTSMSQSQVCHLGHTQISHK
jgi:hypothetical protein